MRSRLLLASIACAATFTGSPAAAQGPDPGPVLYGLGAPPSQFEWGCFGPCACPVLVQSPVVGSFVLTRSHVDPLFTYYDVTDVRWKIESSTGPVEITGAGTYRLGGEVALTEELTLDLAFGQGPVQHFDSGLKSAGAVFPEIHTSVSLHGESCHDSVVTVDAKPIATASVGGDARRPSLIVGPNPSAGMAMAVFTLPRDAVVDLGVYDLAGRRIRAIATHEALTGGIYTRVWDGRRDDGATAPPGLYLIRLETPGGRVTRTAVRVR